MEAIYNQCDVNANMKKSASNGSAKTNIDFLVKESEFSDDDTSVFKKQLNNKTESVVNWKKLILKDEALFHKLTNYISDKIKLYVRDKYIRYLNLTREEREFSKTGYTYAKSWSYDSTNRSWDWEVPNMSRISIDAYRENKKTRSTITLSQNMLDDDQQSTGSSTAAISEFNVPSTPVRNMKRSHNRVRESPFTRSQCRGGVLCEANCEVHKRTRQRNTNKEGTRIPYSGIGLEPSDNFINEQLERNSWKSGFENEKNIDDEDYDFDILEHRRTISVHRNTRECYEKPSKVNGPLSNNFRENLLIARKAFSGLLTWRYLPLLLLAALCLFAWGNGLITADNFSSVTSKIASHANFFSASVSSSHLFTSSQHSNLDAKSLEELQELKKTMETVKDKLSHLTIELQRVKQDGMVSHENYNSLRASLEELNKKFNNCCRNETELVSFIGANLLLMLSNAQSEEGRMFSTLLKNMVQIEMQKFQVQQTEIDDKIDGMVEFVVKRLETVKSEMQESVNELSSKMQNTQTEIKNTKVEVSVDDVKKLIREALFVYDADKTGIPDYALESSGGTVIDIRCSETFDPYGIQYKIFGIPVWSTSNSPRAVIQPTITPGDCWAFKGPQGHLVMKLSKKIVPTSFTYEHISKQISRDGNINSAPREFQVRGLKDENDKEGELLGSYYYEDNGMPLQNFAVTHPNPKPYIYIELVITSNHGHDEYTCLYRFRVHGKPIEY